MEFWEAVSPKRCYSPLQSANDIRMPKMTRCQICYERVELTQEEGRITLYSMCQSRNSLRRRSYLFVCSMVPSVIWTHLAGRHTYDHVLVNELIATAIVRRSLLGFRVL